MNVEVTVYHRMEKPQFLPYASGDALAKRYSYGAHVDLSDEFKNRQRILNEIWRDNNVVDGYEVPTYYMTRSLAIGDVFVIDYGGERDAWCVEAAGFENVELDDVWSSMWRWDELKEQPIG